MSKRRSRLAATIAWTTVLLLALSACSAPPPPSPTVAKPAESQPAAPVAPAAPAAAAKPAEAKPSEPKPAQAAAPETKPAVAPESKPAATRDWPLPAGNVTINLWDTAEASKNKLYNEVFIPEYTKLHPNVKINYEAVSTPELMQKLLVGLSTGIGPEAFTLPDWFMPTYHSRNLIDPVPPKAFGFQTDREVIDQYIPGRVDIFVKEGKLYALPFLLTPQSLYVNTRMFQAAGLDPIKDAPKTWDDVAKLNAKLVKRDGDRLTQRAFEMRYIGDQWMLFMFNVLTEQAGGHVLTDGKPTFNQDPSIKAMSVWKSVTVAPKVTKNTGASPWQDFADQFDAMSNMPSVATAGVELLNPGLKGNYSIVPLPQLDPGNPKTLIYGFTHVVNAKATDDQKRVAWDFLQYTTSQPALWMQRTAHISPLKGWYETPEAKKIPFLDILIKDLSIGQPLPRSENFNELQSSVARAVERIVYDNMDPKQSLDQAVAEFERVVKR
jgi:multiple sugar transport system substrate-binding protein